MVYFERTMKFHFYMAEGFEMGGLKPCVSDHYSFWLAAEGLSVKFPALLTSMTFCVAASSILALARSKFRNALIICSHRSKQRKEIGSPY
jgi:hypothetical protein